MHIWKMESGGDRDRPGSPASVVGEAAGESVSPRMAGPKIQDQLVNVRQMTEILRTVTRAPPQRSAVERLAKYLPTDFRGKSDDDATVAEYWFERTERILQQMHCTPEESLECAISLLQEDAYHWWTAIIRTVRPAERTWEFFQREFRKKYVGRIYIENMKRDFVNLKQTYVRYLVRSGV
ncbi:hypothetical protein ACOSP7_031024 [Xanthoceras sorbifolium]